MSCSSEMMINGGSFVRMKRSEKDLNCKSEGGSAPSSSSQFHVLAVDDSLVDRTVIERLLKISAYKVTTVDSGKRALQFLGLDGDKKTTGIDDLKVNMIITDYCMPGMTGYELLKKIKESTAFKEIPVVIMSSENVLARTDRCLEEGAEEFIVKPVKLSDVKRLEAYIVKKSEKPSMGHKRKSSLASSPESPLSPPSSSPSSSPPPREEPPARRHRTTNSP